ncbi:MAG: thiamine pyrophosphate-binding protein [Thermoleophilaceae bacterium]
MSGWSRCRRSTSARRASWRWGWPRPSGRPVAVTCTSGSAAANLMPAVVEAWEARVPLIVLTADRPPELRDVGAGQAIDQIKLYGSAAKWFVELGNSEAGPEWNAHVRATACRAWWTAAGGRPGPVHVNMPLREPLAPVPEELSARGLAGPPRRAPPGPRSASTPRRPTATRCSAWRRGWPRRAGA